MPAPLFARGRLAWGLCQRCGLRALLNDLVFDGYIPGLRVHAECFEPRHPQERLQELSDPVALWRPSPEQPNSPGFELTAQIINVLTLFINQDHISPDGNPGLFMTDMMTPQEITNLEAGFYSVINIVGSGAPGRGYWVVSGDSGIGGAPGGFAFIIDDGPDSGEYTVNLDASIIRFYGGGGGGGITTQRPGNIGSPGIYLSPGVPCTINLNVTLQNGANIGRIFAGGSGGGYGSGNGSGGAAGWNPGLGANNGGIYDPANGGTGNPDVLGGAAVGTAGKGGKMGEAGGAGALGIGGAAKPAIERDPGVSGTTTILTGNDPAYIRGVVQ